MITSFLLAYLERYQPFKPYWNYEDACVLLGCQRLYAVTGFSRYADFVLDYLAQRVEPDGSIPSYPVQAHSLDSFQCGKLLFFAAAQTGEKRYRRAIEWQYRQLSVQPRTPSGFCWHKGIYSEQIWIDGLYMMLPFLTQYAVWNHIDTPFSEVERCFRLARNHMRNPQNGLYCHGLDEARMQVWANAETGLSPSHWLRGEGWLLMALVDCYELLPDSQASLRCYLADMLNEALESLLPYRAEDGLFYQVIDHAEQPGNYTETSGSCMVSYAMLRGAELGMLPWHYAEIGTDMLNAIQQTKLITSSEGTYLCDICGQAGLGGYPIRDGSCAYYLSESKRKNDPKGVGAFMLALAALTTAESR